MRIAALAVATLASVSSYAADGRLNHDQLASLLSGAVVTHVSPRSGRPVMLTFNANGSVDGVVEPRRERGRWSVDHAGLLCFQFPTLEKGRKICHYLVRHGNRLARIAENGEEKRGEDWVLVKSGGQ